MRDRELELVSLAMYRHEKKRKALKLTEEIAEVSEESGLPIEAIFNSYYALETECWEEVRKLLIKTRREDQEPILEVR